MIPEAEQIKRYDNVGNMFVAWAWSAGSLQAAARLLKTHRDRFDPTQSNVGDVLPDEGKVLFPELMLQGLAVENLLKALWVKRGSKLVAGGEYLGVKGAADHNLLQLANAVALQFSPMAKDVLKRLSIIITSAGRYPIPKKWFAHRIQKLHGGGKGIPTYWRLPEDDKTLQGLIATIEKELEE